MHGRMASAQCNSSTNGIMSGDSSYIHLLMALAHGRAIEKLTLLKASSCSSRGIVHPVQWSIHREPTRYPQPEKFIPDRWLDKAWPTYKEPLTQYPNLQNFNAFGFGRRICPSQHIAERSMYILIARIAWCCSISQKLDPDGKSVVPPEYDYVTDSNVRDTSLNFVIHCSYVSGSTQAFGIRIEAWKW